MDELNLLELLVILLLFSAVGVILAKRLKLPGLVGILLVGIILKILSDLSGFSILDNGLTSQLAEIGLALLLFLLGIEFDLKELKGKLGILSFFGAGVQICLTTLIGVMVLFWFGWGGAVGLILALGLSLSSTAVVVKLLTDKKRNLGLPGVIAVAWLLVQDLAVIPILLLLPFLSGSLNLAVDFHWLGVGGIFLFLLILFFVIDSVFDFLAKSGGRELLILVSVGLGLGMGLLFDSVGLSLALGSFIAGVLLSSSSEKHEIFAKLTSLRDLFASMFFLFLGLTLSWQVLLSSWYIILSLVFLFGLIKILIILLELLLFKVHLRVGVRVALSLMEAGEFAFVIGLAGLEKGILSEWDLSILSSVVVVSMLILPILMWLEPYIYNLLHILIKKLGIGSLARFGNKEMRAVNLKHLHPKVVIIGYGRVGGLVGEKLFKRVGRKGMVVIDYNLAVVSNLTAKNISAIFGDAQEREILELSGIERAKLAIVAIPDIRVTKHLVKLIRSMNKNVFILSRVHRKAAMAELKTIGADKLVLVEESAARLMFNYARAKLR